MLSRAMTTLIIIIFAYLLIDIYVFRGLNLLFKFSDAQYRIYSFVYWSFTVLLAIIVPWLFIKISTEHSGKLMYHAFMIGGVFMIIILAKLNFAFFHLTEDIVAFLKNIFSSSQHQSRNFILSKIGLSLALLTTALMFYGIIFGRFAYVVTHNDIYSSKIPPQFDGLKIVQISDLHLGSYTGHEKNLIKAFDKINKLNPDIIVFTGDLVNHYVSELKGWEPIFQRLQPTIGMYSILGNHDYGDYIKWKTPEEKQDHLKQMKKFHKDAGFHLLLNTNKTIEKDSAKIVMMGVENWGKPPFKPYGKLKDAMLDTDSNHYRILLSHDPSHWDLEVIDKTNIDLTLSGHTHAMQAGIKIGKFMWSPSKYIYPRWNGMYQHNNQYLYVNKGLGYIGYPGRIGMRPEITLITLHHKD